MKLCYLQVGKNGDNQSTMFTAKNKRLIGESQHIALKYDYFRHLVKK